MTVTLGDELQRARRAAKIPQIALAERCDLNVETIIGLEAGRGTVGSLMTALSALRRRPSIR